MLFVVSKIRFKIVLFPIFIWQNDKCFACCGQSNWPKKVI